MRLLTALWEYLEYKHRSIIDSIHHLHITQVTTIISIRVKWTLSEEAKITI